MKLLVAAAVAAAMLTAAPAKAAQIWVGSADGTVTSSNQGGV